MIRRSPAHVRPARRRSFTLVELLVVIAILAVLMGIGIYGVLAAIESGRVSKAQQTIEQLRNAIDGYESRFGYLPPVSLREYGISGHNDINSGNETLLLALRTTRDGEPLLDITRFSGSLENRDNDSSAEAYQLMSVEGHPELFELVDPWGNPYVYIPQQQDSRGDPYARTYTYIDENGNYVTIDPRMWKQHSSTGAMPRGYMLWSFGPNGINQNGFADDIVSWDKDDDERQFQPEVNGP